MGGLAEAQIAGAIEALVERDERARPSRSIDATARVDKLEERDRRARDPACWPAASPWPSTCA